MKRIVLLAVLTAIAGCGSDTIGPIGPVALPFDLTIPPNRPAGDLYAVSGIVSTTQPVRVGDSIVEGTVSSFYAQFSPAPGVAIPASVLLNGNLLERSRNTDTLRLDGASSLSVLGNNLWKLIDSSSAADSFPVQTIDVLDSVGPFKQFKSFRSDTDLTLGWMPPRIGSGGMFLIWKAPDTTMVTPMADIGSYRISSGDLVKLRGKGSVTLVRYLNIQKTYKGKTLVLTRLAEHRYEVTIQ